MELSYEFRRRCEAISANQRHLLQLDPHEPMQGECLAAKHKILLCEPHDMPGVTELLAEHLANRTDWDGVLLPNLPNRVRIILLRPKVSPTRRQSTIMHEMAHLLLDHVPITLNESDSFTSYRTLEEKEATYLGGSLQIPHVGLIWARQMGFNIRRTAEHFNASEDMVKFRANVMRVPLKR